MQISVVKVGEVVKEPKYSYFELTYSKDGKLEKPRKIMSFNAEYATLLAAAPGSDFDVELKKDDNGFWKWVKVLPAGSAPAKTSGYVPAATFEASRQKSIVRQSSLAQAVASLDAVQVDVGVILERAEAFENWVNRE